MQVYNDYGKNHISMNCKINQKNIYSISHHKSEKIIIKKFLKHKKMFMILRMGNVFGLKKYVHQSRQYIYFESLMLSLLHAIF